MAALCFTYHQLKYSSPNRSKKPNKSHTKEPTFRKKEGLAKKRLGEYGPKAEKDKTESAKGLGRRTREEIYREVGSNWQPWDSRQGGGGWGGVGGRDISVQCSVSRLCSGYWFLDLYLFMLLIYWRLTKKLLTAQSTAQGHLRASLQRCCEDKKCKRRDWHCWQHLSNRDKRKAALHATHKMWTVGNSVIMVAGWVMVSPFPRIFDVADRY